MKRLFAFLSLSLLIALQATAQNLSVAKFELLPNDMTASKHGTERFDRNGEKCAIIKVVAPQRGFHFNTGMMHLAHQEDHPGETWIWVSPLLQHITISHDTFGKCDYDIPIVVDGGRTYEMLLDIGTGRFVSITTSVAGSTVVIDGKDVGKAPLYNHYLDMGLHNIVATNDKYEGRLQKVITMNDQNGAVLNVVMEDQSRYFGNVTVEVDGDPLADIFFNGKKAETGTWRTQLREGSYTVETRKADADPQTTTFQVVAGKDNKVKAIAPTPHTGYLQIYTVPRSLQATIDGGKDIDLSERHVLPVGNHQLSFQKKGYYPQENVEYKVTRYETTLDTIRLQRIDYIKNKAFYFGAGLTLSSMSGLTGIAGLTYNRHDVQLHYTFGISKGDEVHWYDSNNGTWMGTAKYKQGGFGIKYGYQFSLLQLFGITPQVGYSYASLSSSIESTNEDAGDSYANYADNASAHLATIGVKLLYVPMHHVYVFAAPQYALTVGKSDGYDLLSNNSDVKVSGFSATIGLMMNF